MPCRFNFNYYVFMKTHLTKTDQSTPRRFAGFTLTELFVVITTTAILALLMLPALARAQTMDHRFTCFENFRQLTLGWLMYANSNNEKIARTGGMDSFVENPNDPRIMRGGALEQWCPGSVDAGHGPASTNALLIMRGAIFPQVRNVKVYKCPADMKNYIGVPTVRSVSINCWFNPINAWMETNGKFLRKLSDMTTLPPARTWTFIEENADSINDGWFVVNVGTTPRSLTWIDYPASYHDNAATLSFADGHVEIKKWSDKNVLKVPPGIPRLSGDGPDLWWLSERATAMR